MAEIVEIAYEKACEALRACKHERGIKAAAAYYPHIWARDGVIASFGALLAGEDFTEPVRASLETLGEYQNEVGHIPNFIPVEGSPGRVNNALDSNLWFVIGHKYFFDMTGDADFLAENIEKIKKALLWLRYQDFNDCGLLEAQECADWADLFANRFNVLFTNVLYYAALRAGAQILETLGEKGKAYYRQAEEVRERINTLFYLPEDGSAREKNLDKLRVMNGEWATVYSQMCQVYWFRPYYFPYIPFRLRGDDRFDTLGNMLAVVFGVADKNRANAILDYVRDYGVARPFPAKACFPPVMPGHPDWRDYYLNREYCKPHSAHNGGIWPFIGGFYVLALVAVGRFEEAKWELIKLAEANRLGREKEWEFNELLHGLSGLPIGAAYQAWSAGMYIVAYRAVQERNALWWERWRS